MKRLLAITAVVLNFAPAARADEAARKFEVAPFVGAYIPTGNQRDLLDDAVTVGLTASYALYPYAAIVGSFSYAPTKVKTLPAAQDGLDLFQYDLGVEGRYPLALSGWLVQPFVGVGAGARTYHLRDLDLGSETDFAGYFAAGVGAQRGPLMVRVSARDYLTPFDGLTGGGRSTTRNDLGIDAGVGMRF